MTSAKSQFMKKLQARQPAPVAYISKSEADLATFRLRMTQLQEQMDAWLVDTGLTVEVRRLSITDLLAGSGAFAITGIVLRYEYRAVSFTPLFLYGQGVTGGVGITLHIGERITPLGRLFMRAGNISDWTFTSPEELSGSGKRLDESLFFELIAVLLSGG